MKVKVKKSFNERVYEIVSRIPRGRVATYSDIASQLGSKCARAVGNALNKNPYAPRVPCHRVVRSNGDIGGFAYGTSAKVQLLKSEGVRVSADNLVLDFELVRFGF